MERADQRPLAQRLWGHVRRAFLPRKAVEGPQRLWRQIFAFVRIPLVLFLMALIIEYFVIPRFVVASEHLNELEHINPGWLVAGVVLEAASLFAYSVLTKVLLPPDGPGLSVLWRIDLSGLAIAHVIPGGTAGSATLGYRLLTQHGVSGEDAGFAMATQGMGSAVVLNVLLWIALILSIPFAGVHKGYVAAALVGTLLLAAFGALIFFFTRGEEAAVRLVRAIGEKVPRITPDQLERLVRHIGAALRRLAADRERLKNAVRWAAANWLLDAACLWCFVAALGRAVNPLYVLVAYGVGNVVAAIPITPGGLGLTEATTGALLTALGVRGEQATLAVIGWRFLNFWVPIPVGGGAYLSLRAERGASRREGLRQMVEESRERDQEFDPDRAHSPTGDPPSPASEEVEGPQE